MKRLALIIYPAVIGLYACCGYVECLQDDYTSTFRILSSVNGKDLVFGADKIYDKTYLRFYSIKGGDTTFFDYRPLGYNGLVYDSVLYVDFYPQTDTAYVRFTTTDIDTLVLSYDRSKGGPCCSGIIYISSIKHNRETAPVSNHGHVQLRK